MSEIVEIIKSAIGESATFGNTTVEQAQAALAALSAAGFVVVPRGPTEAMFCAGSDVPTGIGGCPPSVALIYRAMVDAYKPTPAPQGRKD